MRTARKVIYIVLFLVFAAIFIYSAVVVGQYFIDSKKQSDLYGDLSDKVSEMQNSTTEPTATVTTPFTDPESKNPLTILPEYAIPFLQNTDMVGWIRIPGTNVDYPVVQSPNNPDFYLNHNFNKDYTSRGAIYVEEDCDVNKPSDNITIYGHNMKDETMFYILRNYQYKEFWEEHKTIQFDTLTERHTYEVIAVFLTSGYLDEGFSYHLFVDASSPEQFDRFVRTVKNLDYFDTGVSAEYGDKLICLSTCEYSIDNGRLVVVAKRIS